MANTFLDDRDIDVTLTQAGKVAEAKKVGDALAELKFDEKHINLWQSGPVDDHYLTPNMNKPSIMTLTNSNNRRKFSC